LVYTDSQEYTYKWNTQQWETTLRNWETTIINPQVFTVPISAPNTLGRDAEYQEQLDKILGRVDDFSIQAQVSETTDSTDEESESEATLPTFFISPPSPPHLAVCCCGIDTCWCDY
jgi:hypothetical protein